MTAPLCPILQVAHLPSSSSFYASILQPLDIHYLSSASTPATPHAIHFGYLNSTPHNSQIVFTLAPLPPSTPPVPSHLIIAAPTPASVEVFYNSSLLANPSQYQPSFTRTGDAEVRALIRDLDGNMLEAVYDRRGYPRRISSTATEKEARRVLEWQENVARSVATENPPPPSHPSRQERDGPYERPQTYRRADSYPQPPLSFRDPYLVRRETVREEHYRGPRPAEDRLADTQDSDGNGLTGMKIVGTLLGAAAGAAVAYAMVRSDSPPRSPRTVPGPYRRASVAGYPNDHGPEPTRTMGYDGGYGPVERVPTRSYVSRRDREPRYVDYVVPDPPRQDIDERSYVSRDSRRSQRDRDEEGRSSIRPRSRSKAGRFERPLAILPSRGGGSHVSAHTSPQSSRGSCHDSKFDPGEARSHHSKRESRAGDRDSEDHERESYVSARSHRSESTAKPGPHQAVSTMTIKCVPREEKRSVVSARHVPLPPSEAGTRSEVRRSEVGRKSERSEHGSRHGDQRRSEVSARNVPLPRSVVSGYAASVAPSDSVSSVGSKRERERLMERMKQRW